MSFFSSIVSFFTGGGDTANKVIDNVSGGLDKLNFSEQEKTEARLKGFELFIKYQEATLPQNVARRSLAMIVLALWVSVCVLIVIGIIFNLFYVERLSVFLTTINPYVGGVWAFYFVKRMVPVNDATR